MTQHDLTVVICTLNEQANIVGCLDSLGWDGPLVVVDGGSTDRTVPLVRLLRPDATVVVQSGGLLKQRVAGVREVQTPLLAFVDADDRLEPGALDTAVTYLKDRELCAVQLAFSVDGRTAMSAAYSGMLQVSHPVGMRLGMLGRPCVIWADKLPDNPETVPEIYPWEDAWLHASYLRSCMVEVCAGSTVRLQPLTVREAWRKTWLYGRGDADQLLELRRFRHTAVHLLWRYPVVRGGRALRQGRFAVALLCVTVGWVRFISACWHLACRSTDG
jgi:glycosyltransferase involved in cell wall biosynthesis